MVSAKQTVFFCRFLVFILISVIALGSFGCEPLRKKFRREKKKEGSQSFIPVLEPIDYAPKMQSPEGQYSYHYSMWQIWQKDLLDSLYENESEKQQLYLLNQIIVQLEGMNRWILEEKQKELSVLVQEVYGLLKEYDKPSPMRSMSAIQRTLERNGRKVRESFKPIIIKDHLSQ
jgi:hypothetical protein